MGVRARRSVFARVLVIVFATSLGIVASAAIVAYRSGAQPPGANGASIVFTSDRDGQNEIYVMNANGTNQRRLTNNAADDFLPAWSPDGETIAFTSKRAGHYDIWLMDPTGANLRNLTTGINTNVRYAAWSPDGLDIAFMSMEGSGGNFDIFRMSVDNPASRIRLTSTPGIEDCCVDWSPDGARMVFSSIRTGDFEIFVMNADGSAETNITNRGPQAGQAAWSGYDGTPGWLTRDRLLFRSIRNGVNGIFSADADGSDVRMIVNGRIRQPAGSPDGTKVLYVNDQFGNDDIWVVDADGSGATNLSNSPGTDQDPDWLSLPGPQPTTTTTTTLPTTTTTTTTTTLPPGEQAPPFLTLLFSRLQIAHAIGCEPATGSVPLDTGVGPELDRRGIAGTMSIITQQTPEADRGCGDTQVFDEAIVKGSWNDARALRDQFGWTAVSQGRWYNDLTQLSTADQIEVSCGSLPDFTSRGFYGAHGLFAYPNDRYSTAVQRNVVSTCFAYGRTYGNGPGNTLGTGLTTRAAAGEPYFQTTQSISGGRCVSGDPICNTIPQNAYMSPVAIGDQIAALDHDEWYTLQAYRFVEGYEPGRWDCRTGDWRGHWTRLVEDYCWTDFVSILDRINAGTTVVDPLTVAEAWGRSVTPPTTTTTTSTTTTTLPTTTTTTLPPDDSTPPDGTVVVPAVSASYALGPLELRGTATDGGSGVIAAKVAIRNPANGTWWNGSGWGGFTWVDAEVAEPGATSTTWSLAWTPPATGTYGMMARVFDAAGNADPSYPWVKFFVVDDPGPGTDPDAHVTAPAPGESLSLGLLTFSGTATDDTSIASVSVAIKNRDTGQWWTGSRWGNFAWLDTILDDPGATTTAWSFTWAPPAAANMSLMVRATDGSGNIDPAKPWINFVVVA